MTDKAKKNAGIVVICTIIIFVIAGVIKYKCKSPEVPKITPESTTASTETTTTTVDFEQNYELFVNFINDSNSKELAANVINETNELKAYVMHKAISKLEDIEGIESGRVESIKCWIHSYKQGDSVGVIALNGDEQVTYNYNHNGDLLAASLLCKKYPDNLKLADARISALVLTKMSKEQIEKFCIQKDSDGKEFYNLSIRDNADFANAATIILA